MLRFLLLILNLLVSFTIVSPAHSSKGEHLKTIELRNVVITNEGAESKVTGEYYTRVWPYDSDREKYKAKYYILFVYAGEHRIDATEMGGPSHVNTSDCSWYNCVAKKWGEAHGSSGSFNFKVQAGGYGGVTSLCFYGRDGISNSWGTGGGWGPMLTPGGDSACSYSSGGNGGTVVNKDWCTLYSDVTLSFDFGTLLKSEIKSAKKSNNLKVYCTHDKSYKIKLKSTIVLSNGMDVTLKADGKDLGSTLNGVKGDSTVEVSATLSGTPQKTGAFTGQGILYVDMP
ncbi:hypothetical protein KYI92_13170 [Pantoea allii]|uniref:Adhesin n=1 Tax=Pantoea allii TaxID=574096 RepID=A0ABS6VFI0_9GAMM|nr:hypothetical protein [Pantoea allii]MBW1214093.1 hypothetical protein [Pantoea allii]MBW1258068.1 hypothetical protein [Pantoea allii]MBW1267080.1 hypothetical protein [Pantoea allii]MBW1289323.1 hypothetical protein [Pantoea allii]